MGMHRIVMLQDFNGSWKPCEALAAAFNSTLAVFELEEGSTPQEVWATALALAFLRLRLAVREDEWILIARKASSWISKAGFDVGMLIRSAGEKLRQAMLGPDV